jgi:tetratricopeptide (TPR) repeat protein
VVARIAGNDEWLTVAETRANGVLAAAVGRYSNAIARVSLALIGVQRGDVAAAEEHYAALALVPGLMVFYVSTYRVLGQLSATLSRLDQAADHFEDALAFNRSAGYRPDLAWSCYDYADVLLQRASTGSARTESEEDRRKAMSLLDEALAISSDLGMRPLMERVLSRREILNA